MAPPVLIEDSGGFIIRYKVGPADWFYSGHYWTEKEKTVDSIIRYIESGRQEWKYLYGANPAHFASVEFHLPAAELAEYIASAASIWPGDMVPHPSYKPKCHR